MNLNYVLSKTGNYLSQLSISGYRPTGSPEHVQASTFYVGIGILVWLATFAFVLVVQLRLSMLNSGLIQRKVISPILLWALSIIYQSSRRSTG